MIFHVVVLVVAYRRPKTDPALPLAFTIVTILLALGWVCAYAVTCAVLCQHHTQVQVFETVVDVPQTFKTSQKLQVMLDPFVCVILGDLAYKSHKRRMALLQCNGDFDDVESDCWSRNTDSDASSIQSEPIP